MNRVLMYHSIGGTRSKEAGADLYAVSVENFRKQMHFLKARGGSSYIVTFDDGLEDNFTIAYPILEETGIKAYFFPIVSKIATPGYMNWQQLKQLQAAGHVIGSHGMTHRILTVLPEAALVSELNDSKQLLEEALSTIIEHFSVPRGFCNQRLIAKIKAAGYTTIFTSRVRERADHVIGRIAIKNQWEIDKFISIMRNGVSLPEQGKELVKDSVKKIIGAGRYDALRTKILRQ